MPKIIRLSLEGGKNRAERGREKLLYRVGVVELRKEKWRRRKGRERKLAAGYCAENNKIEF